MKKKSNLMSKDEIIKYLVHDIGFFEKEKNLCCSEIGDGNINYIFIVRDEKTNKSVVVKQSDTLLRSSGRPLDIYRSKIEVDVLKMQYDMYKGSVPQVYNYDSDRALIVMEDISSYKNLRKELLSGNIYENLGDSLSDFLANTLLQTTDLVIDRAYKKKLCKKFVNPDLCDITEDLVLTEPYYDYKKRNIITAGLEDFVEKKLYNNDVLHKEVLILKDRFQNYSQALLHGDLHSGSIFVNENGIKVIDPEFAFYGPIGYDIGNVLGNLIFPLINHIVNNSDKNIIGSLKNTIEQTVNMTILKMQNTYDNVVEFSYFKNTLFKEHYLNSIFADSFGYAGTEIIRRTVGDSKVEDIKSITDIEKRKLTDKILINIGIRLILKRNELKNGRDLLKIVKEEINEHFGA